MRSDIDKQNERSALINLFDSVASKEEADRNIRAHQTIQQPTGESMIKVHTIESSENTNKIIARELAERPSLDVSPESPWKTPQKNTKSGDVENRAVGDYNAQ